MKFETAVSCDVIFSRDTGDLLFGRCVFWVGLHSFGTQKLVLGSHVFLKWGMQRNLEMCPKRAADPELERCILGSSGFLTASNKPTFPLICSYLSGKLKRLKSESETRTNTFLKK